jgi:uncharacterized protein (TIGR03000 family)
VYGGYYGGFGYGYPFYGGFGYGGLGYGAYGYGGYPSYGYSSGYYSSAPAVIGAPAVLPSAPPAAIGDPVPAVITITVPDGAQIWIDGKETAAPGGKLVYTSPAIQQGARGVLNIKARWNDSTRELNLPITAGDKMTIDLRNQ